MRNFLLLESVREIAFNNKEMFIVTYDITNNPLDKEEVLKILPTLWNLLLQAYNNDIKGVKTSKKLFKNSNIIRVVYYKGQIVACGFYSNYRKGNKLMYGGAIRGNLHEIGKQGFDAIIHRDVENIEEYNWVEASGSVEKAFKRHNAYMLPNKYVNQVLDKEYTLCEDGFHYERIFDDEVVRKMIFGIKSKELLEIISNECFGQLLKDVKTTYEKIRAIQNITEEKEIKVIDEKNRPAELQYAINIMCDIDEYIGYTNTYDFPESLIKYLIYSKNILYNYSSSYNVAKRAYENCNDLLIMIQPLKIISKKAIEIINIENVA